MLAGPGVVDAGAIETLRALADAGGLGVANTWGAKGVFAWDSPHHLGTCGLQARDFELLGFAEADAIVTIGLDPDEAAPERVALADVVDIAPGALGGWVGNVVHDGPPLENRLYPRLAAVAQPGYTDDKVPLHPARAVADLGAALPTGGLLVGEPGVAGLWVARTFPTPALMPGEPRRVEVPARRAPAVAVRRAAEAASEGRPSVAVVAAPLDGPTAAAIERLGAVPVVVEVWADAGDLTDADAHRRALDAALGGPGPTVLEVPVCAADTDALVAAAGAVVAWGGL